MEKIEQKREIGTERKREKRVDRWIGRVPVSLVEREYTFYINYSDSCMAWKDLPVVVVLWSIVTWRDLQRPQPRHRYRHCFSGLVSWNLDPSIYFFLVLQLVLINFFFVLQSLDQLLLGLSQSWSTSSWSCPLRLLSLKCSMLEMLILNFPAFFFQSF